MKVILAVLVTALIGAGSASAAKPWQWSNEKASKRLFAISHDTFGLTTKHAACRGLGVQRRIPRYSAFRCHVGNLENYSAQVWDAWIYVRILPVGSGKLCVIAEQDGRTVSAGQGHRVAVVPERICP